MLASELCRIANAKYVPHTHAAVGALFLLYTFNIFVLKIMLIVGMGMMIIANSGRKLYVWIYAFVWLVFINIFRGDFAYILCPYLYIDPRTTPELIIIMSWNLLRLLSFSLDYAGSVDDNRFGLAYMLGYIWYFPNMYFGPFMLYRRYEWAIRKNGRCDSDFRQRLKAVLVAGIRITFWYLFVEFSLHYVYVNFIQQNFVVSFLYFFFLNLIS